MSQLKGALKWFPGAEEQGQAYAKDLAKALKQSRQQEAENKYAKPFAAPKFKSIWIFLRMSQQPIEGIFQFLAEKPWKIKMEK